MSVLIDSGRSAVFRDGQIIITMESGKEIRRHSKTEFLSRWIVLASVILCPATIQLTFYGAALTGAGHGTYTVLWLGMITSGIVWLLLLTSAICGLVRLLCHKRGAWWGLIAFSLFVAYPVLWHWYLHRGEVH